MSVAVSNRTPDVQVQHLQQQVQRMQGHATSRTLPVVEALAPLVSLQTGAAYAVDSLSLALAVLAGPSAAGEWSAVVGLPDLGWEAARDYGVDLSRTVAVPRPGEHWLTVTAGLIDVATVVVVRPPGPVSEHQAARLAARLRQRDACLLAVGSWPRAVQRLSVSGPVWHGLGRGHGHLTFREVTVTAVSGSAPSRRLDLRLPAIDRGAGTTIATAPGPEPVLRPVEAG